MGTAKVRSIDNRGCFETDNIIKKSTGKASTLFVAEREGFEPSVRLARTLVFETSQFNHSCISPYATILPD